MSVPSSSSSFPAVRVKGSIDATLDELNQAFGKRPKPLGGMEVRLPEPEGWDVPVGTRRERKQKAMSVTERARQRILARQRAGGA